MRQLHEQLQELLGRVQLMGSLAELMIQKAIWALTTRNEGARDEIFAAEEQVNTLQVEIDDRAVRLTALQQPVAGDVRFLFMASKIAGELERIADQAVNIADNAHYVLQSPPIAARVDVPAMAEIAQKMVRDTLAAMVNRDIALANSVLEVEKKVDAFRDQIFHTLLAHLCGEAGGAQRDISLILIARNLERIGDHATNIAEEVIYWLQGRDVRHGKGVAVD